MNASGSARDRSLDRAKKLAALARDQEGSPEGETAARMFAALRERWSFTDEELAEQEGEEVEIHRILVEFGAPRLVARADLLSVLGHIADVVVTFRMSETAWVGRVYSGEERKCQAVVTAFGEVEKWLNRHLERSASWTGIQALAHKASDRSRYDAALLILRKDWWMTACAMLMRVWRSKASPEEQQREVETPPSKTAEGGGGVGASAKGGAPAAASSPPPENLPSVVGSSGIAVKRKQEEKKIAGAATTAPIESFKWIDEAAHAVQQMPDYTADLMSGS